MTFVLLCFKTILAKPLLKVLSMFVVSVISQAGMLDGMLVENVRNAWGGGVVDWLAPDEAAEFSITAGLSISTFLLNSSRSTSMDFKIETAITIKNGIRNWSLVSATKN